MEAIHSEIPFAARGTQSQQPNTSRRALAAATDDLFSNSPCLSNWTLVHLAVRACSFAARDPIAIFRRGGRIHERHDDDNAHRVVVRNSNGVVPRQSRCRDAALDRLVDWDRTLCSDGGLPGSGHCLWNSSMDATTGRRRRLFYRSLLLLLEKHVLVAQLVSKMALRDPAGDWWHRVCVRVDRRRPRHGTLERLRIQQ